jgi:hypothetical protein
MRLFEQIAKQQYEIKALVGNQVKVQPKASESYRTVTKALAEKCTEFHTYKLKERMKLAPNNRGIFNIEYIQQCKIKFELPKHERDIAHCANCQKCDHNKNYCHFKPRCVKCAR